MFVIGLTGLARAGKDAVAQHLKKHGFKVFAFSDVIKENAVKKGIEPTKSNLSIYGDKLRQRYGEDVIGRMLLEKIEKAKAEKIAVTGFRSPAEVLLFRESADIFYLIEVTALPKIRFARRKRDDPQTWKEFFERDERDIKNKGLGKVLRMVDACIENNSTLSVLGKKIDKFLERIK